jgi:hypothetical protein
MFLIKGIETAFCNKMSDIVASASSVNSAQVTMGDELMRAPGEFIELLEHQCYNPSEPGMCTQQAEEETSKDGLKMEATDRKRFIDLYAIIICEKTVEKIKVDCTGCKNGSYLVQEHNLCKIMKKGERIEKYFSSIMDQLTDGEVREKWNAMFTGRENGGYITKEELTLDVKFVKSIKNKALRLL